MHLKLASAEALEALPIAHHVAQRPVVTELMEKDPETQQRRKRLLALLGSSKRQHLFEVFNRLAAAFMETEQLENVMRRSAIIVAVFPISELNGVCAMNLPPIGSSELKAQASTQDE
eukprot:5303612-Amphidinium_carterae.1